MKLELKHIAPYLPYGLKYQWCSWGEKNTTEVDTLGTIKHLVGSPIGVNDCMTLDRCKPILRPLSDLTRDILEDAGFACYIDYLTYEFAGLVELYGREYVVNDIPYGHMVYLLSNLYDIFGLIDAGLAIDINTLQDEKQTP